MGAPSDWLNILTTMPLPLVEPLSPGLLSPSCSLPLPRGKAARNAAASNVAASNVAAVEASFVRNRVPSLRAREANS